MWNTYKCIQKYSRSPVILASIITIAFIAVSFFLGFLVKTLNLGLQTEMVVLVILTLIFILLVTKMRWWKKIGFLLPFNLRGTKHWWVPWSIVLVIPFVIGFKLSSLTHFGYLVVGYLLTGFLEEGMFRGIIWKILLPLGEKKTILITSTLFALIHIGNLLYRNPAIVFAQMIGAFVDGIGLGAIKARSGTIWMVIGLHSMHDLALKYSNFSIIPLDIVQVTLLMIYGVYILKKSKKLTI